MDALGDRRRHAAGLQLVDIERDREQVPQIAVNQVSAGHKLRLSSNRHRLSFAFPRDRDGLQMRIAAGFGHRKQDRAVRQSMRPAVIKLAVAAIQRRQRLRGASGVGYRHQSSAIQRRKDDAPIVGPGAAGTSSWRVCDSARTCIG